MFWGFYDLRGSDTERRDDQGYAERENIKGTVEDEKRREQKRIGEERVKRGIWIGNSDVELD